jgi:hypothetical protein
VQRSSQRQRNSVVLQAISWAEGRWFDIGRDRAWQIYCAWLAR